VNEYENSSNLELDKYHRLRHVQKMKCYEKINRFILDSLKVCALYIVRAPYIDRMVVITGGSGHKLFQSFG